MNLEKLFQTQKVLRDRIGYNEPDRFNKLILALLVELGECANEWRGFKFWSTNQSPRTRKARAPYMDLDDADFYNPLLEEFVDKLHFILELGLEVGVETVEMVYFGNQFKCDSITEQFIELNRRVVELWDTGSMENKRFYWDRLFLVFAELGEMLGFTWDEIEQAYFTKNKINHVRQETGY
jgi:dimeric dUTPase (all-alpha-NTP-PPase superfamily)